MGHRFLLPILAALLAGGCVERTISIRSEPSGALVHLNDEEVGRTPLTVPFTFYGTYAVRLEKQGYETLHAESKANPPWWDLPGPDVVAEAMPGDPDVRLNWAYKMKPAESAAPDELINRAKRLRQRFDPPPQAGGQQEAQDSNP